MNQVTKELVAAVNAHDLDRMVSLFHPEYHSQQPAHPNRGFGGSAQVRDNWSAMLAGIPDLRSRWCPSSRTRRPAGASGDGGPPASTGHPSTSGG